MLLEIELKENGIVPQSVMDWCEQNDCRIETEGNTLFVSKKTKRSDEFQPVIEHVIHLIDYKRAFYVFVSDYTHKMSQLLCGKFVPNSKTIWKSVYTTPEENSEFLDEMIELEKFKIELDNGFKGNW